MKAIIIFKDVLSGVCQSAVTYYPKTTNKDKARRDAIIFAGKQCLGTRLTYELVSLK